MHSSICRTLLVAALHTSAIACSTTESSGGDPTSQTDGITSAATTNSQTPNATTDSGIGDSETPTVGEAGGTAEAEGVGPESAGSGSSDGSSPPSTEGSAGSGGSNGGVDCGGTVYACGDGIDNDGDGFSDLTDPECTGPCDNDESSFQTSIPGDNMDCRQDCFFDGNSGQGDDGCNWNLRCDPADPGASIGCSYTGGNNCDSPGAAQGEECLAFCEQFVPPGCDCFGCCTVQTEEGSVNIFLNSDEECALDNLDACGNCTPQADVCGNPCVPEDCEVCFGETEPPPGCEQAECPGTPCGGNDECQEGWFCYLGCCYPPPPG